MSLLRLIRLGRSGLTALRASRVASEETRPEALLDLYSRRINCEARPQLRLVPRSSRAVLGRRRPERLGRLSLHRLQTQLAATQAAVDELRGLLGRPQVHRPVEQRSVPAMPALAKHRAPARSARTICVASSTLKPTRAGTPRSAGPSSALTEVTRTEGDIATACDPRGINAQEVSAACAQGLPYVLVSLPPSPVPIGFRSAAEALSGMLISRENRVDVAPSGATRVSRGRSLAARPR